MRLNLLLSAFVLLVALLLLCWKYRFEYASGSQVVSLADLRANQVGDLGAGGEWRGATDKPCLRLSMTGQTKSIVQRIRIPEIGLVQFLHVKFRLRGDGLVCGKEVWKDGRVMLEWYQPGIDAWKLQPLGTVRDNQSKVGDEFVVESTKGAAVPVLRLEHLGQAGAFELQELELREVCETALWRYGRWVLVVSWLAWGYAVVRSWKNISLFRALTASAVFVTMGIIAVVPGQWKIQRPLGVAFMIKENPQGVSPRVDALNANEVEISAVSSFPNLSHVDSQQPLGKIPVQGGLLLKAKHYLPALRPILHMLLIMAPTLVMAWLAGWRPALLLSVTLSAAIEIAQTAFGYGFDRTDVIDLVCDAIGIAAAMITYQLVARYWRSPKA